MKTSAPGDLSVQQAADLLNVGRSFVLALLNKGEIPCRKVGACLRVRRQDVLTYRRTRDASRRAVLDRLTLEAQELSIYGE